MKTADCDILILPGYAGSEEDHWQARWAARLKTARIVEQADWHNPDPESWRDRIAEAVAAATRPVVLIAHSLGVVAAVEAAPRFPAGVVRGALLVAFPDIEAGASLPESVRFRAGDARSPALPLAAGGEPHRPALHLRASGGLRLCLGFGAGGCGRVGPHQCRQWARPLARGSDASRRLPGSALIRFRAEKVRPERQSAAQNRDLCAVPIKCSEKRA